MGLCGFCNLVSWFFRLLHRQSAPLAVSPLYISGSIASTPLLLMRSRTPHTIITLRINSPLCTVYYYCPRTTWLPSRCRLTTTLMDQ